MEADSKTHTEGTTLEGFSMQCKSETGEVFQGHSECSRQKQLSVFRLQTEQDYAAPASNTGKLQGSNSPGDQSTSSESAGANEECEEGRLNWADELQKETQEGEEEELEFPKFDQYEQGEQQKQQEQLQQQPQEELVQQVTNTSGQGHKVQFEVSVQPEWERKAIEYEEELIGLLMRHGASRKQAYDEVQRQCGCEMRTKL